MKIYTKTGDTGMTGVFGGRLCAKDDIRVECNGKLDEVNSYIGLMRSKLPIDHVWQPRLKKIQVDMMDMMSHIATHSSIRDKNKLNHPEEGAEECEKWIDEMYEEIPGRDDFFILPGGTEVSALCHIVRTTLRTAERRLVTLNREDAVLPYIMKYINRMSDLFFALSRYEIYKADLDEEKLRPFKMSF